MSNFEVKIEPIFISQHPDADALEIGNIGDPNGWQCVVKKGLYKTGDLVAYIGENAVVPEWVLKQYGFWSEEKNKGLLAGSKGDRVKMVRLRGAPSLGICIPIKMEQIQNAKSGWLRLNGSELLTFQGDDVSAELGVTKYEPPIPAQLAGEVFNGSTYVGVNYDIEDIKKFPNVLEEGEQVQMTVKIHGCVDRDTLIMLPNGDQLPIHQIISERHQNVLSFDTESGEYKSKKITGTSVRPNTERKRWVAIKTEDKVLKLTEDHPVFSRDRNAYIEAKDIKPGEEIESPFQ